MEKNPSDAVKELVSQYIQVKPRRISLKLYWNDKRSLISLKGDGLDKTTEYAWVIDFTSFAHGVVEAYREAFGELREIPISFRETVYRSDKVVINLYPTGSAGIFDIYIDYTKERPNR